jgi:hypothetical protein
MAGTLLALTCPAASPVDPNSNTARSRAVKASKRIFYWGSGNLLSLVHSGVRSIRFLGASGRD